ncbi:CotO family spore coat protein [Neobacillus sp. D3-1R]|uniref:CotO family spore coat protein n=1 Tax=Neobacillus sp. D3-1R TaxID=3445778 RepID=UPI003FA15FDF
MASKKNQQPLLYIQQPTFNKQIAPMQQSFFVKNRKNKPLDELHSKELNLEEEKEQQFGKFDELLTKTKMDTLSQVGSVLEETDDPKVMEFIIEGILSSEVKVEEEKIEETQYIRYLDSIQEQPFNTLLENTTLSTSRLEELDKEVVNVIIEESNESTVSKKTKKRPHFNHLDLSNKLNELKKMPPVQIKVLYEFITINNIYMGYFISYKDGVIKIDTRTGKQHTQISDAEIVDINIIGI